MGAVLFVRIPTQIDTCTLLQKAFCKLSSSYYLFKAKPANEQNISNKKPRNINFILVFIKTNRFAYSLLFLYVNCEEKTIIVYMYANPKPRRFCWTENHL